MYDLADFTKMTNSDSEEESNVNESIQQYEEKQLNVHDEVITIREYHFSQTNAGFVWPSTFYMTDYIMTHKEMFENKRIIELGTGTGILSIFLNKKGFNVISSDIESEDITNNIEFNKNLNNISYEHIPHSWGTTFPVEKNNFDIIIASDIILYVPLFEKLINTLRQLMDNKPGVFMIMSYKRKLYDSKKFFVLLNENDFQYEIIGSKLWLIKKKDI